MTKENPRAYPLDNGNYELIWWIATEDWVARFTDSKDRFMLPVFVGGKRIEAYRSTNQFDASPRFVAIGILYSWDEPGKWMFAGSPDELDGLRFQLLNRCVSEAGYDALEEFVIAAAAWLRWECGCRLSQKMIGGAIHLIPRSGLLRFDYVLDTWSLVERIEDLDVSGACQSILSMANQADVSRLNQQQINSFCFITLASMLLLGMKQEFHGLFENWADSIMQAPNMQSQLRMAAALPKVGIDDLRILTKPRTSRAKN